jgi:hypothetical protein
MWGLSASPWCTTRHHTASPEAAATLQRLRRLADRVPAGGETALALLWAFAMAHQLRLLPEPTLDEALPPVRAATGPVA